MRLIPVIMFITIIFQLIARFIIMQSEFIKGQKPDKKLFGSRFAKQRLKSNEMRSQTLAKLKAKLKQNRDFADLFPDLAEEIEPDISKTNSKQAESTVFRNIEDKLSEPAASMKQSTDVAKTLRQSARLSTGRASPLVQGVIWSEILDRPRSQRPHKSFK